MDRAKRDLAGQTISVVLLSGGSSNIRWLRPLIERDLRGQLGQAQILELSENFQEIVAKGLAVECARRYYTEGRGDFRAVTYNRLCLLLKPDDEDIEVKPFRPMSSALNHDAKEIDPNVLLPAASSLRGLVGEKLQWKVKPNKLPRRSLQYYFMRSSFDPDDLDARHNIVDTKVYTPPDTQFQQNITVELVIREDGTAEPRFIYGKNDQREGTTVAGTPFFIDMTFATEEVRGETYLGFDFGTSTSSCSYVSSTDIALIEERSRSTDWLELGDLVTDLPYPAAGPLAKYMSEMDPHRRLDRGREAVEAMLTLLAYVAVAELSSDAKPTSSLFKGLAHRSAGPLWGLLKQSTQLGKQQHISISTISSCVKNSTAQIDKWVDEIAGAKHGRPNSVDFVAFLGLIGNCINKTFEHNKLGIFENVTPKRFSNGRFTGIFRELRGASQTFINVLEYEGARAFTNEEVYIVNKDKGTALCLSPYYLWDLDQSGGTFAGGDLFEFDNVRKDQFIFKSVQSQKVIEIDAAGPFGEIHGVLRQIREREHPREPICDLNLV